MLYKKDSLIFSRNMCCFWDILKKLIFWGDTPPSYLGFWWFWYRTVFKSDSTIQSSFINIGSVIHELYMFIVAWNGKINLKFWNRRTIFLSHFKTITKLLVPSILRGNKNNENSIFFYKRTWQDLMI